VLAGDYKSALDVGFLHLREALNKDREGGETPRLISMWLCCISLKEMTEQQRIYLMSFESYFGIQYAKKYKFPSIMGPLYNFCRDRVLRLTEHTFPVPISTIILEEATFHLESGVRATGVKLLQEMVAEKFKDATDEQKETAKKLLGTSLSEIKSKYTKVDGVLPCGFSIPSAAARRAGVRSFISGTHIQGPEFWLNQLAPSSSGQAAAISLADAIMWNRCCVFSPTGDGQTLPTP